MMLPGDLRNSAVAGLAVPDANGVALDAGLAAESADVLGVLGDFHLLHRLSEGGTISLQSFVSCCVVCQSCVVISSRSGTAPNTADSSWLSSMPQGRRIKLSRHIVGAYGAKSNTETAVMVGVGDRSSGVIGLFVPSTVLAGN